MCTSTCDVAKCVCASVWYVHIHMLHAVKTSVCGVCHYRQPCVYNSVHESHEAHTPRGVWAMETLHVRASLHRRDTRIHV